MIVKMKCPICGNEEFYVIPTPSVSGNRNVYTTIMTGFASGVNANRYACSKCGYLVEKFEGKDLDAIAKKYGK